MDGGQRGEDLLDGGQGFLALQGVVVEGDQPFGGRGFALFGPASSPARRGRLGCCRRGRRSRLAGVVPGGEDVAGVVGIVDPEAGAEHLKEYLQRFDVVAEGI